MPEEEDGWIHAKRDSPKLSCSHSAKRPFSPPQRRSGVVNGVVNDSSNGSGDVANDETVDMEGWKALYEKPFHKELEVRPRGRFHLDMEQLALEQIHEKPQLPLESVQNALLFKRVTSRKQLLGSVL